MRSNLFYTRMNDARQARILELTAQGIKQKHIAERMGVSASAVCNFLQNKQREEEDVSIRSGNS